MIFSTKNAESDDRNLGPKGGSKIPGSLLGHIGSTNPMDFGCTWYLSPTHGQGKIRSLGVSNFGPRQMRELFDLGGTPVGETWQTWSFRCEVFSGFSVVSTEVAVNQLEYHPWVPNIHRDTVNWCHRCQTRMFQCKGMK